MKNTLLVVGFLFFVFVVFVLVAGTSPEAQERSAKRQAIELCWNEQRRRSLDPATARFAAGACERMENEFVSRFGVRP